MFIRKEELKLYKMVKTLAQIRPTLKDKILRRMQNEKKQQTYYIFKIQTLNTLDFSSPQLFFLFFFLSEGTFFEFLFLIFPIINFTCFNFLQLDLF
jgi:hypothetical protein